VFVLFLLGNERLGLVYSGRNNPLSSVLKSRQNTFEVTAKVIGASSSEPKACSDTTSTFVVVSSSTRFTTLATIYIKQFPKGGTILFLTPKLPTPPPPEAIITSSFCQANPYTGKPTFFFMIGILGAILNLALSNATWGGYLRS
jgi:hypothetical protein